MADFQGIIVIHKEKGFTSHDVVAKLRGILHMKKIGHTGTLDPDATGVLPVALGKGTKLVDLLTDKEKTYEAVLHLGIDTDTQDMSGTVLEEKPVNVTEEEVRKVLKSFVGEQLQIPPMYSALKVNGKKLYELAREGKTVERKARPVCFYEIEPLEFHLPLVKIRVTCSKGTYIRTLCADIGERLGVGGMMQSLVRTRVSCFSLKEAHTLAQIEHYRDQGLLDEILLPVDGVFGQYPGLQIADSPQAQKKLCNGNRLATEDLAAGCRETVGGETGRLCRVYDTQGKFCGIYEWDGQRGDYKCKKMFL